MGMGTEFYLIIFQDGFSNISLKTFDYENPISHSIIIFWLFLSVMYSCQLQKIVVF